MSFGSNKRCRLCVSPCEDYKSLYEESGHGNELYEIILKYFHPTILDMGKWRYLTVICLPCWCQISDFHFFQMSVIEAQSKLVVEMNESPQMVDHSASSNVIRLGKQSIAQPDAVGDGSSAYAISNCKETLNDGNCPSNENLGEEMRGQIELICIKEEEEEEQSVSMSKPTVLCANDNNNGPSNENLGITECVRIKEEELEIIDVNDDFNGPSTEEECVRIKKEDEPRRAVHDLSSNGPANENLGEIECLRIKEEYESMSRPELEVIFVNDNNNGPSNEELGNIHVEDKYEPELEHHDNCPDSSDEDETVSILYYSDMETSSEDDDGYPTARDYDELRKTDLNPADDIAQEEDTVSQYFDMLKQCGSKVRSKKKDFDNRVTQFIPSIKCVICAKYSPRYSLLRVHFFQRHPEDVFYIECCNRKFRSIGYLLEHLCLHVDPTTYSCDVCGKFYSSQKGLGKHQRQDHPESTFRNTCSECHKTFETLKGLGRHHTYFHRGCLPQPQIVKVQPDLLYPCKDCGKRYQDFKVLRAHRNHAHPFKPNGTDAEIPSSVVNQSESEKPGTNPKRISLEASSNDADGADSDSDDNTVLSPRKRPRIKKKRNKDKLDKIVAKLMPCIKCGLCSMPYCSLSLLENHFDQKHPTEKFFVSCCNRKMTSRSVIRQHFVFHNDPEAFKCKYCGEMYTMKSTLQSHVAREHKEVQASWHPCTKCPKRFETMSRLKYHCTVTHGFTLHNAE